MEWKKEEEYVQFTIQPKFDIVLDILNDSARFSFQLYHSVCVYVCGCGMGDEFDTAGKKRQPPPPHTRCCCCVTSECGVKLRLWILMIHHLFIM